MSSATARHIAFSQGLAGYRTPNRCPLPKINYVGRTVRLSFSPDTLGGLVLEKALSHPRPLRYRESGDDWLFALKRGGTTSFSAATTSLPGDCTEPHEQEKAPHHGFLRPNTTTVSCRREGHLFTGELLSQLKSTMSFMSLTPDVLRTPARFAARCQPPRLWRTDPL